MLYFVYIKNKENSIPKIEKMSQIKCFSNSIQHMHAKFSFIKIGPTLKNFFQKSDGPLKGQKGISNFCRVLNVTPNPIFLKEKFLFHFFIVFFFIS